jgi:hypothetical protein
MQDARFREAFEGGPKQRPLHAAALQLRSKHGTSSGKKP